MAETTYVLRYLPLFYDDLEEKLVYIAEKLMNPEAANELLDAVETAILERLPNAESNLIWIIHREMQKSVLTFITKKHKIKTG